MSAQTKVELETALVNHLQDEGIIKEGELLSDYLILAAYLPIDRDNSGETVYVVVSPDRAMPHQFEGLASWYLFRRKNRNA